MWQLEGTSLQNLFGGLSPGSDFVDLVQNGYGARPVNT
jgi:hypothetical protein